MSNKPAIAVGDSYPKEQPKEQQEPRDKNGNVTHTTHIKAKYIPHPRMLKLALDEIFGKKQYECDMRNDTYNIFSPREVFVSEVLDAVERQEVPKERPTDKSTWRSLFFS